jgi:hypothetical protein
MITPKIAGVVFIAAWLSLDCSSSPNSSGSEGGVEDQGPSEHDGSVTSVQDGGNTSVRDGGSCAWSGTWSLQPTPLTGDCSSAPPLPVITIAPDGSATANVDGGPAVSCVGVKPDPKTCQAFPFCGTWELDLSFGEGYCMPSGSCTGVATNFRDGGLVCSVSLTLTPVSP